MTNLNEYMNEKGITINEVNMFEFHEWEMFKLLEQHD